jgi:hypothetical protein
LLITLQIVSHCTVHKNTKNNMSISSEVVTVDAIKAWRTGVLQANLFLDF